MRQGAVPLGKCRCGGKLLFGRWFIYRNKKGNVYKFNFGSCTRCGRR